MLDRNTSTVLDNLERLEALIAIVVTTPIAIVLRFMAIEITIVAAIDDSNE